MRNKRTLKELGFVLGACIIIAIIDKTLIIFFGHSILSEIFSGR